MAGLLLHQCIIRSTVLMLLKMRIKTFCQSFGNEIQLRLWSFQSTIISIIISFFKWRKISRRTRHFKHSDNVHGQLEFIVYQDEQLSHLCFYHNILVMFSSLHQMIENLLSLPRLTNWTFYLIYNCRFLSGLTHFQHAKVHNNWLRDCNQIHKPTLWYLDYSPIRQFWVENLSLKANLSVVECNCLSHFTTLTVEALLSLLFLLFL